MSNEKDYENKVNNDDDAIDAEIVDDELKNEETGFSFGQVDDENNESINDVNEEILTKFINKYKDIDKEIKMQISEIEYLPNDIDKERFLFTMNDGNYVYITIYKTLAINEYNKILPNLEGKKGILYLDSGNYFEILS